MANFEKEDYMLTYFSDAQFHRIPYSSNSFQRHSRIQSSRAGGLTISSS
jgi:hypothetical protein